jgi:hypothetical protein
VFGKCWLAFLRLPLDDNALKVALIRIVSARCARASGVIDRCTQPSRVMPSMSAPLLLCDLLSAAFARGGVRAGTRIRTQ